MNYRLGLDIGTSSVAIAAFRLNDQKEPCELIHLDEYIFGEPVEPKTLALKNNQRRLKRLMRRQLDRKKARITKLLHLASLVGVTPAVLRSTSLKLGSTEQVWRLRADALDKPVTWAELILILLRLAKNRGYAGKAPKATKSVVGAGIKQSQEIIAKYKARTLGEALWSRYLEDCRNGFRKLSHGPKDVADGGGTYVLREDIENEFDLIITSQARFLHQLTQPLPEAIGKGAAEQIYRDGTTYFWGYKPETLAAALRLAIFYQRPLPSFEDRIGKCELESSENRVSPAHPLAQRFRLLQTVSDMTWKQRKNSIPLSLEQVRVLINCYQDRDETPYSEIYDEMTEAGCPPPPGYKLSLHTIRQSHFKGDSTRAAWRHQKLIKQWDALSKEIQGQVIEVLSDKLSSPEQWAIPEVRNRILESYCAHVVEFLDLLTNDEGGLPRMASLGLASGRVAYGITALRKLTTLMETAGLNAHDARMQLYGDKQTEKAITATGKLPPVDQLDMTNPVVKRALKETAKVLENCIKRFGPPDAIVIEMMREMRQSLDQRRETSKRQAWQERRRKEAASTLRENGYQTNDSNIRRYLLWKEQLEVCPYSGKRLGFSEALDPSATQLEHILPHSLRGVGNRVDGLVLATTQYNMLKSNETPWGAYQQHKDVWNWDATVNTTRGIAKKNPAFKRKAQLITNEITAADAEEESLDEFADRQFSDTAWIARIVHQWCKHLCGDVIVIRGGLTASLRRQWGFDNILQTVREAEGKTGGAKGQELFFKPAFNRKGEILVFDKRSDHRHHLIDAVTIGLSTRSLYRRELQRKAAYRDRKSDDVGGRTVNIPCPIPNLREHLIERLMGYVVWKKPDRLVTGRFFDEEPFSPCAEGETMRKRGVASKRKRSINDSLITHKDRHGKEHSKVIVNSEYACMRLKDGVLSLVTLLEFNKRYLRGKRLHIPENERLFFKGDTIYYPEKKAFLTIVQILQGDGLMCLPTTETIAYDTMKGTGLNVAIGSGKKLETVTIFANKQALGHFIASHARERESMTLA